MFISLLKSIVVIKVLLFQCILVYPQIRLHVRGSTVVAHDLEIKKKIKYAASSRNRVF